MIEVSPGLAFPGATCFPAPRGLTSGGGHAARVRVRPSRSEWLGQEPRTELLWRVAAPRGGSARRHRAPSSAAPSWPPPQSLTVSLTAVFQSCGCWRCCLPPFRQNFRGHWHYHIHESASALSCYPHQAAFQKNRWTRWPKPFWMLICRLFLPRRQPTTSNLCVRRTQCWPG